ncbi:MAG TPA: mycothiol synthase [Acidimicrobiales bacterium]|nr:mycothiol synthase [Acidimicrobiales bacterium]
MHHVEIKRRMGEDDIATVAALLRVAEAADGHAPLGEHKWLDLVHGGRAGFAGFVAREPGHDRVVGYAQLSRGPDNWAVEYVVHPAHRHHDDPVGVDLLRAALAEVGREGGGHVHVWVPKPTALHDEVASAAGLSRGRELLQLRRALPLEEGLDGPGGAEVRAFRVGEDEAAWLELNNRAFHGHPEQGAWGLATLREREQQPWFDPAGFLLHEREGRLAAFCWTKIHDDEPLLGEIYVLGVDPHLQGHGLGHKLLVAGCEHLAAKGIPAVVLYVDADNAPAVALYSAAGFHLDHRDRAYVGDIPAAP